MLLFLYFYLQWVKFSLQTSTVKRILQHYCYISENIWSPCSLTHRPSRKSHIHEKTRNKLSNLDGFQICWWNMTHSAGVGCTWNTWKHSQRLTHTLCAYSDADQQSSNRRRKSRISAPGVRLFYTLCFSTVGRLRCNRMLGGLFLSQLGCQREGKTRLPLSNKQTGGERESERDVRIISLEAPQHLICHANAVIASSDKWLLF